MACEKFVTILNYIFDNDKLQDLLERVKIAFDIKSPSEEWGK